MLESKSLLLSLHHFTLTQTNETDAVQKRKQRKSRVSQERWLISFVSATKTVPPLDWAFSYSPAYF